MSPKRPTFLTRRSSGYIDKTLSSISDFSRSLNLSVMLNDVSLRETYATAETNGELPTNRARVLILGEPRAGKTSLLNRLLGRGFDNQEAPTEGIEMRMCHVTNVDKSWRESGEANLDDIQECASAVVALGAVSTDGSRRGDAAYQRDLTAPPSTQRVPEHGIVADLVKLTLQLLLVTVVLIALGLFHYGYAVFVWFSIGALALVLDYNNAYRFATSMSLSFVLFEAMIRNEKPLDQAVTCDVLNGSSSYEIHISKSILFNLVNTVMVGLACGLGGRTGIAVAFSACVHPWEGGNLIDETTVGSLEAPWNMWVLCGILVAGGVTGFGCYTYCTINDRWHKMRTAICCSFMAVLLAVYWTGECSYRPYWFVFLNGVWMTIGGVWGALFGRRASHKYGFRAGNYILKKSAGFVLGLYLAHECGWTLQIPDTTLSSLALYVLSVTAHPLFDLHIAYRIWRVKSKFPIKLIRGKMKSAIQGRSLLETKLSLWDFAGDTLYHCAHHVFMPDRALYVIVFNLEAAVSDEDGQLQKLLFWMHSVCAHARHPDAVVMIVGTHKASVCEASRLRFSDKLHRLISSPFCHRLVLNPSDDKPLFLVENSQPFDQMLQELREEIFRRVESAEYAQESYPIKYLHFFREIQNQRKLAEVDGAANVMTLKQFQDLAAESCGVEGEDEWKNMLQFFCEAGEILYRDDDEVLRQHILLDPQFLVDATKKLVLIPRASCRWHRYATEWRDYENSGIISAGLLQHIYGDMPHLVLLLTHLLRAYDLMCPVTPILNLNCSQKSFLVPTMLPPYQDDSITFWETLENEEIFYFDFGFFDPSTVYYRLLTRYLTHASLDKVDPNSQSLIFSDRCRIQVGTKFIFKLQLERRSSRQMLLSVAVLTFEPENPSSKLLKDLVGFVRSITARDYPHLCFTFGPRCPVCVPAVDAATSAKDLTDYKHDEVIHVLKVAGHDQSFPTKSPAVMFCGQKRYEWRLSGSVSLITHIGASHPPQRVAFDMDTSITKLPPDLFQRVCSFLNNSAGLRNWKALAGELGKDVESVAELDSECVANPTERLLREWAMTDGSVTVADLLEVLGRPSLERRDIVAELCVQMTQDGY